MNKFDALNIVTVSDLGAADKALLTELILRSDDNWYSWPSVQRLCMARGIKYEKNFKGADAYLPGIVSKQKVGRKMTYTLDPAGIKKLEKAEVIIKHTPAQEGAYAPAQADNTPAVEGANTSKNTTSDTSNNEPVLRTVSNLKSEQLGKGRYSFTATSPNFKRTPEPFYFLDLDSMGLISTTRNTPAQAGVSRAQAVATWGNREPKVTSALDGEDW